MSIAAPSLFSEDVCAALEAAAADKPSRPVAVFDYDNTCIHGDIGELFAQYLVDEQLYRTDLDEFWDLIDPRDGRDNARELAAEVAAASTNDPGYTRVFADYRAEMSALYARLTAREGKAVAYAWAALLHVGLTEDEMREHSARCVELEWRRELGRESLQTRSGESVSFDVGMRRFAAIREVQAWLRSVGYEVWIVSATNLWTVQTAAKIMYGHDPAFAVGNRVRVDRGVLTTELDGSALYKEGKVEAIQRYIGVQPAIVFGDSETDLSMMEWASSLAVLMDHGDEYMLEKAAQYGWPVQPHAALDLEGPATAKG